MGSPTPALDALAKNEPERLLDPRDPAQVAQTMVAERFTNSLRSLHRHRGTFWRFRGSHYVQAGDEAVRAEVWKFLASAAKRNNKGEVMPFKPTVHCVSGVLDALKAETALDDSIETPAWLDDENRPPANEFLAVANGLLHLPSGKLHEATPGYFGLSASDVVFDQDAPAPDTWLKFLSDLFGDDFQAIETLQDWFGYALTPDTSQQKVLLVVGHCIADADRIGQTIDVVLYYRITRKSSWKNA